MRPSSHAAGLFFIPVSVAEWADERNWLPHFVAFFPLALIGFVFNLPARWVWRERLSVIGYRLVGGSHLRTERLDRSLATIFNVFFLFSIVILFELPQIWLPARAFSVWDLIAGWAGVALALLIFLAMSAVVNRFRPRYSILNV